MNKSDPEKKRELVPDILQHQAAVNEQLARIESLMSKFSENWNLLEYAKTSSAAQKEPMPKTPVIEVYDNMREIQSNLSDKIIKLSEIVSNYLGEKYLGEK